MFVYNRSVTSYLILITSTLCNGAAKHRHIHRPTIDDEQFAENRKHLDWMSSVTMQQKKLQALRWMMTNQQRPLAAYIVPTADAHNSEYICATDARRQWLTGFTGSAGTALVTGDAALCWTDGRYYTQFQREAVDWTLMRQSLPETLTMEKWLVNNLVEGSLVGADPTTMRRAEWTPLRTALSKAKIELVGISSNLVDAARERVSQAAAPRPSNPLVILPAVYTGKTAAQKIKELRKIMSEHKAGALIITALDEVAYTLNVRGSDIEYNPVFFAYLVVKEDGVVLFFRDGDNGDPVLKQTATELDSQLTIVPYKDVFSYLENMACELSKQGKRYVMLSHDASEAIHVAAAGGEGKNVVELISEVSPVALAKYVKNPVELQGFRDSHVRDGLAVIRFFCWLDEQLSKNVTITEIQASEKLLDFRKEEKDFMGASFETIMAAGSNAAIIHYAPSRTGAQTVIKPDEMFLVDSGGHYKDGTTDITRTRISSAAPALDARIREVFTRVLRGQISVATARFPKGIKGSVLDVLARKSLWDVGLDYGHGTGHGVGHYLNVHEGPSGISYRVYPDDPGVSPGAIFSNEPGFYQVGVYGIRIEDLVEVVEIKPNPQELYGDFDGRGVLGFKTLTMVPHQTKVIDTSMLTAEELRYLNEYHQTILDVMRPIMLKRNLTNELAWLEKECKHIS